MPVVSLVAYAGTMAISVRLLVVGCRQRTTLNLLTQRIALVLHEQLAQLLADAILPATAELGAPYGCQRCRLRKSRTSPLKASGASQ
jgi:hypothetical protein